jgi:hypothetical protein
MLEAFKIAGFLILILIGTIAASFFINWLYESFFDKVIKKKDKKI